MVIMISNNDDYVGKILSRAQSSISFLFQNDSFFSIILCTISVKATPTRELASLNKKVFWFKQKSTFPLFT